MPQSGKLRYVRMSTELTFIDLVRNRGMRTR